MDIKDLSNLVVKASAGEDDLDQAAIGFQGYGFVFRDFSHSDDSYVNTSQSGKVFNMGAYRGITEKALQLDEIESLNELIRYDEKYDC